MGSGPMCTFVSSVPCKAANTPKKLELGTCLDAVLGLQAQPLRREWHRKRSTLKAVRDPAERAQRQVHQAHADELNGGAQAT